MCDTSLAFHPGTLRRPTSSPHTILSPIVTRTTSSIVLAGGLALAALYALALAAGIGIPRAFPVEKRAHLRHSIRLRA